MTDPQIERNAEIIADMVQSDVRSAIADYHKCKDICDAAEDELLALQEPGKYVYIISLFLAKEKYDEARKNLELAIDTLDAMGVVEYQ